MVVFPICGKNRLIRTKRDKVGEVILGHTKTPLFLMGFMFLFWRVLDLN